MPNPRATIKYSTLRATAQSSLPFKYRFNSHAAKNTKKIVALAINILCAVMSFIVASSQPQLAHGAQTQPGSGERFCLVKIPRFVPDDWRAPRPVARIVHATRLTTLC